MRNFNERSNNLIAYYSEESQKKTHSLADIKAIGMQELVAALHRKMEYNKPPASREKIQTGFPQPLSIWQQHMIK